MVDLGRFCSTGPKPFCGAHALRVAVYDANARAFDRYRGQLDAIARSVSQLRPAASTTGDAGRPACRPEQWRLACSGASRASARGSGFPGVVRYRGGPACHLRLKLRMTVERDGRPLPVAGSPAVATVGGLLPEDDQRRLNRLGVHDTPLTWELAVDEWCNQELAGASLRLRPRAAGAWWPPSRIGSPCPTTPDPAGSADVRRRSSACPEPRYGTSVVASGSRS